VTTKSSIRRVNLPFMCRECGAYHAHENHRRVNAMVDRLVDNADTALPTMIPANQIGGSSDTVHKADSLRPTAAGQRHHQHVNATARRSS